MKKVLIKGAHTYVYLLIVATIIAVFSTLTTIGVSAVEYYTAPYTYNGKTGVTITGFKDVSQGETVIIPPEVKVTIEDGEIEIKPVLAIGLDGGKLHVFDADKIGELDLTQAINLKNILPYAFSWCPNIKGSIESETVEIVGDRAFDHCTQLTSFSAPKLTKVGNHAFDGCTSLKTITLKNNCSIDFYQSCINVPKECSITYINDNGDVVKTVKLSEYRS